MAAQAKSPVKIVFGAMTIGKPGVEQARVTSLDEASKILDVFQKHGHNEIDTARVYGGGSSEEYLGQLKWQDRGLVMDTKLAPTGTANLKVRIALDGLRLYTHSPEELRAGLLDSLKALQTDKIDTFYLHAPDRTTPYISTLREINNLHKEGYFSRFGISNYAAWEVAQITEICIANDFKRPDVYQGIYNALHRTAEPELFPCLRNYNISFYQFNPLAGGFLTDRYTDREKWVDDKGSRFDESTRQGVNYRRRYWNEAYFDALDVIRPVVKKYGISTAEAALRWVSHHSLLDKEKGDAVIIGASSADQLEENLVNLEKGPLPEEVVEAFERGWGIVKGVCSGYFH